MRTAAKLPATDTITMTVKQIPPARPNRASPASAAKAVSSDVIRAGWNQIEAGNTTLTAM